MTVAVHTSAATLPILAYGTDEQKSRFVPPLARGEHLGAFALTEAEAGSRRRSLRTKAEPTRRRLEDHRREAMDHQRPARRHVHALRAHRSARQPGRAGVSAFILDAEHVRVTRDEEKLGLNSSVTNDIVVEGARGRARSSAPRGEPRLSRRDGHARRRPHRHRRAGARHRAGRLRGGARATRRSGAPSAIASRDFQAIQHKLADMSMEIDAARLLVYRAALAEAGRARPHRGGCEGEALRVGDGAAARRPKRFRSSAGTATRRSFRSSAITATRRSPRSTKERARSSAS